MGYQEKSKLLYLLPPEPVSIHAFIRPATHEESKIFFANNRYLHLIFGAGAQIPCLDELLLTLLKQQAQLKSLKDAHLHDFVATFSLLCGNDYRRLKLFLQRAESILKN